MGPATTAGANDDTPPPATTTAHAGDKGGDAASDAGSVEPGKPTPPAGKKGDK